MKPKRQQTVSPHVSERWVSFETLPSSPPGPGHGSEDEESSPPRDGVSFAGLGRRERQGLSLHSNGATCSGVPGAAAAEPTLTHTALRSASSPACPPLRPAPSLTVSPWSGLGVLGEKRELTVGLKPAEGHRKRT